MTNFLSTLSATKNTQHSQILREDPQLFSKQQSSGGLVSGTLIETARGIVAAEFIQKGDLILTRDHGLQPVVSTYLTTITDTENFNLILFEAGAIGNTADLLVSPEQRILSHARLVGMIFDVESALIPAKYYLRKDGVSMHKADKLNYVQIMFEDHCCIRSEGIWTESFNPTAEQIENMPQNLFKKLIMDLPKLGSGNPIFNSQYLSLEAHEAKVVLS